MTLNLLLIFWFDLKANLESIFSPSGTKCSRESLRFCLEMLILRSRIITEHWMAAVKLLVQLSHEWNNTFLEIANVIIPKWQFRAREIVETTILQRQWRQEQEKRIIKSDTKATQTTESHKQDVVAVADGDEEEPGNMLKVRETAVPKVAVEKANEFDKENPIPTDEDRTMRQRLAIAVTICMIFLALQLCLGVVLILMSAQGLLLGQLFLVACVAYIAYLLQSVRSN